MLRNKKLSIEIPQEKTKNDDHRPPITRSPTMFFHPHVLEVKTPLSSPKSKSPPNIKIAHKEAKKIKFMETLAFKPDSPAGEISPDCCSIIITGMNKLMK
jgi:hypothetical protein